MSKDKVIALYARVSSDKQAKDNTIDSQVAAVKEKIQADGGTLPEEFMFIDAGVSGATLVRPALERLRDNAALGTIDSVYFLSPDRLARKYAHQALLLEEFSAAGVSGFVAEYQQRVSRCLRKLPLLDPDGLGHAEVRHSI